MGKSAQRQSGGCHVCIDRIRDALRRFCREELDDEYCTLCIRMLDQLVARAPDFSRSRPESWAAGIVHAAAVINLLNDPGTSPFLTHREIARAFAVSDATMRSKSRHVRDLLNMHGTGRQWTVPSLREDGSMSGEIRIGRSAIDSHPPAASGRTPVPGTVVTTVRRMPLPPPRPHRAASTGSGSGGTWSHGTWEGPAVIGRIGIPRSTG